MTAPLLVIAAGGTGGHMFPAQALAEVMLARGWRVRAMCTLRLAPARRPELRPPRRPDGKANAENGRKGERAQAAATTSSRSTMR